MFHDPVPSFIAAAKAARAKIEANEQSKGYTIFKLEAGFHHHHGEMKITLSFINGERLGVSVEGSDLQGVLEEFCHRIDSSIRLAPLCLPRVGD